MKPQRGEIFVAQGKRVRERRPGLNTPTIQAAICEAARDRKWRCHRESDLRLFSILVQFARFRCASGYNSRNTPRNGVASPFQRFNISTKPHPNPFTPISFRNCAPSKWIFSTAAYAAFRPAFKSVPRAVTPNTRPPLVTTCPSFDVVPA